MASCSTYDDHGHHHDFYEHRGPNVSCEHDDVFQHDEHQFHQHFNEHQFHEHDDDKHLDNHEFVDDNVNVDVVDNNIHHLDATGPGASRACT